MVLITALQLFALQPAISQTEEAQPATTENTVDFARDIAPLLARNCIACHNAKKPEGGLNLESHSALMAGGDSGAAIVAKDPAESYLLSRVIDSEDPMPPADNSVGAKPLTAPQVELLKRWIDAGALASAAVVANVMNWQPIPDQLAPIYALDSSRDGHYLAVGRGNIAQIISLAGQPAALEQQPIESLIDANLKLADGTPLVASHLDLVQSLVVSPDSQVVASGGYRSVKLWRRQTAARQLLAGVSADSPLSAVAPGGARLALITHGRGLELVDIATGQAHRFLTAHAADITALRWLSDQRLLSADAAGGLVLTDANNYHTTPLKIGAGPTPLVQLAVWEKLVWGLDNTGKLFQLQIESGQSLVDSPATAEQTVTAQAVPLVAEATALSVAAQPQASLLVALKNQTVVRLALTGSAEEPQPMGEIKLDAPVRHIEISPDGQRLLTISQSGQAKLWKLASGEVLAALDQDYSGSQRFAARQRDAKRQTGLIELMAGQLPQYQKAADAEKEAEKKVQEARDKAATALATKDSELATAQGAIAESEQALTAAQQRVTELTAEVEAKRKAAQDVEAKRKEAAMELAQREQALLTAADGVRRAAERIAALEKQTASERELLTGIESEVKTLETQVAAPPVVKATFSANGELVAVAGDDHVVRLYQASNGSPHANLSGATAAAVGLQSTADNELRATTADGQVLSWNLRLPWSLVHTIGTAEQSPFSDRITALDFSPDGRLLAVGSGPPSRFGEVQLIDVTSATIAKNLGEVHSDTVLCLRFSPDGRQLASGGADKLCRLWQVDSGEALRAFEGHTHHVLGLAWQDNGQRLATAGADQAIKVWKVESGEQVRTISGFGHEVSAVEFLGETPKLMSVSADGSVKLLNTDDGKTLRSFAGANDALYAVTISADGQQVSAGGQAGQVWTWNIEKGELLKSPQTKQ